MNHPKFDRRALRRSATSTLLGFVLLGAVTAEAATDMTQFSLEELLSMEITSVAKKLQRLSAAAAAIHVITSEDIRRSGMTSIPELLRMVPGLHVARIDASKWAISSRGFNNRWSNKLLVLMDGRSLYTPLYSGVYWDVQDTPLEDIDRIEVIRGPGGTLWGANAVNGVINIITRHSRDTQGGFVTARAGSHENGATLRYGAALGEDGWFRGYVKAKDIDNFDDADLFTAHDEWDMQQAGFRADWEPTFRDAITLQGDIYTGDDDQTIGILEAPGLAYRQDTADLNGGNLLLRLHRTIEHDSEWELQAYFDRTERDDLALKQRIDTFDLNFHHRFPLTEHHEITWGLGYRRIEDSIDNSFTVSFDPESFDQDLYSAFIQDEIRLRDDLYLTLGSKFEHNDFTGFELQPSARLLWQMAEEHTFWGAISRAVRTPSRSDRDIQLSVEGPVPTISIFGSTNTESERLTAFEVGYRGRPQRDLSMDVTLFYNIYDNLISSEVNVPLPLTIDTTFDNKMEGESYGLELAANWQVTPDWRLHAGYSWQKINVWLDSNSTDITTVFEREESNPEQQFQLRSLWNISDNLELDAALFFVDSIEVPGPYGSVYVPDYTRLDLRLGWRPHKDIELSLGGQNLLDNRHYEFATRDVISNQVPRTFYGQVNLKF
jgi:iron complex outermembrane receptor protein